MDSLAVYLVQRASGLDPAENRAALDVVGQIAADRAHPDLVVFPEVFARDFGSPGSDVGPFAEPLDGPFVTRLAELASAHSTTLVSGMFETSGDPQRPYNTLVVVDGSGLRASYRKIHLYDSFGYKESDRLLAGDLEPVVVEIGGFQVGLMTCYDLRFPEMARALVDRGAEVLVVLTEWDELKWNDLGKVKDAMASPRVLDARNLLDRSALLRRGFTFEGVGRT